MFDQHTNKHNLAIFLQLSHTLMTHFSVPL